MNKWIIGVITSVFVVSGLGLFRDQIVKVWAAPEKVETIQKKVEKQESSLEQISALYLEQKTRQDTQEQINELRDKNLKEQLNLIAELKKKK